MSSTNSDEACGHRNITVDVELNIEPSNYAIVKLPNDSLPTTPCYLIQHYMSIHSGIYVCQTLLDEDRVDNSVYIFNSNSNKFSFKGPITFRVALFIKSNLHSDIYSRRVFLQHANWRGFRISHFKRTTHKANGLDIVCEEKDAERYVIQPKGHLALRFPLANAELFNRPYCFFVRSRFAKQGVCILSCRKDHIVLGNMSSNEIKLGASFLQLLLWPALSFELDKIFTATLAEDNVSAYIAQGDCPKEIKETNIAFNYLNGVKQPIVCVCLQKERKCKF